MHELACFYPPPEEIAREETFCIYQEREKEDSTWIFSTCQSSYLKTSVIILRSYLSKQEIMHACFVKTFYFIQLCTGPAPGFIKRVTSLADYACTKQDTVERPDNRALWVELAMMLNIP